MNERDVGGLEDDPVLTVQEIAQQQRLTQWTVRTWIKEGKLRAWRAAGGRRYRIRQSELNRFLREGQAPEPQTQETVRTADRLRLSDDA
jgi:excisionase family DNA binding protein